jgi:hypothetical protein
MQAPIITINGTLLNDAESETICVAIDTLANVLAGGIEAVDEGITAALTELTERYLAALVSIQKLLEYRRNDGSVSPASRGCLRARRATDACVLYAVDAITFACPDFAPTHQFDANRPRYLCRAVNFPS